MNTIKVTLISPFSNGPTRGNITTISRIADHLPLTGTQVSRLYLDSMQNCEQQTLLNRIRPDLLHAFNAHHAGPTARYLAKELGIPYLITITGSDLFDPELRSDLSTRLALADAYTVTCFDPLVARHLAGAFPEVNGKIAVIPQGVAPLPTNRPFPRETEEFIMLLPAAIRPVKGIISAIDALTPLAEAFPSLRLLLAGGDLDRLYADEIGERIACLPWITRLGEVPHHQMGDLFAASDLVLNCSLFEGGMANTLLEAMIMGKPVLARDVLGNRSLISHGRTGWLYKNDDEMRNCVQMLLYNPELCIKTGAAGRALVQVRCSTQTEAQGYRDIYERTIQGR